MKRHGREYREKKPKTGEHGEGKLDMPTPNMEEKAEEEEDRTRYKIGWVITDYLYLEGDLLEIFLPYFRCIVIVEVFLRGTFSV